MSDNINRLLILIIKIVIIVIILLLGYHFINRKKDVTIFLNGDSVINLSLNQEYEDLGFTLKVNNKEVNLSNIDYAIKDNTDIHKPGKYEITYDINYDSKDYELKRYITVVDTIAPIITTNMDSVTRDYCTKKDKTVLEYTALDNYDGDLTNSIIKTETDNIIRLDVVDSTGNESYKLVDITYTDKPKSKFKLKGNKKVYVVLNGKYKENGAVYEDGCGNVIKKDVDITSDVDVTREGTYTVTYKMDNKTLTRSVEVYEPNTKSTKGKVIYLTFDDGPGPYTEKILNILDKYNVKATFFVTHQFPKYEKYIKEEYKRGHTVAVHTYTHNYNVYTSVDKYIKDFNKMNDLIEKYTGSRSKVFRFPGGSSNTVSYNYANGVVSAIAKQMTRDGYVYFDWNVGSSDTAGISASRIRKNVVNRSKYCDTCVVLMHDIKYNTSEALDGILSDLTSKGYKFGVLTESTPIVHHGINN